MNGIVNIYKEAGYTSFDVVAKMRGILKIKKIGHTGTLDPDAIGVLPVCVGNGTKLVELLTDHDKEYVAELLLGVETDTQDISGEVLRTCEVTVSEEEILETIQSFVGTCMQIPPMYSALKVNGQKLCDLARAGKEVERKPRAVVFHEIEVLSIDMPVVKIRVSCSRGAYIRTLCHDIGQKLQCLGTMKSLVRTKVGNFIIEDAITLRELEEKRDEGLLDSVIIGCDQLFIHLPEVHCKQEYVKYLDNGNTIFPNMLQNPPFFQDGTEVRMYGENRFYGIFCYVKKDHRLKPVKMFL